MKVRTLLVAAVMLLAFSAAAFAQATFSVGSTPVTAVISNGLTERTGDITFTVTSGVTGLGTITINYSGVPITNNLVGDISVTAVQADGVTPAAHLPSVNNLSASTGVLVINIPANDPSGTIFRVSGVRVAVANTGLTSLNAQISATINSITAGQTVVQVISAISPAITVDSETTTINSVNPGAPADAQMIATEVFLNAFGGATEAGSYPFAAPPDNGALMVRFTLSTLPPAGMTLSFDGTIPANADTTATWALVDADGVPMDPADADITSKSTPPLYIYYKLTTDSDPTVIESLVVPVHIAVDGTVVGASPIQFTATVAPIGTAAVPKTHDGLIPRYTVSESAATDLILFTGSNTFMLIPYANVATAISYDTGIAISNTSEDPGDTVLGKNESAVPQPGSFTVYFFPQSGTNFKVSSTATGFPGAGLDATGKIPAGGTYVALLSAIVKAAQTANPTVTIPDDFTGYLIIATTFTNAHGLATVSNFQTYTQASPVLIIDGPRTSEKGLNN